MAVNVIIDGINIKTQFGVYLEEGGINIPEKPATPRVPFFNEWEDENGKDYDTDATVVFQSTTMDIPFLIVGKDLADYRQKKNGFLELIVKNGDVSLEIQGLIAVQKLRYVETVSWDFISIGEDEATSAKFTIKFERNNRV